MMKIIILGAEDDDEEAGLSMQGSFSSWSQRHTQCGVDIICPLYILCGELDKFHFCFFGSEVCTLSVENALYIHYTLYTV